MEIGPKWQYLISLEFGYLRQLHWASLEESSLISSIGRAASFLLAINIVYFFKRGEHIKFAVAFLAVICISIETLSAAGRGNIVYLLSCIIGVSILLSSLEGKGLKKLATKKMIGFILVLFTLTAIIFPNLRNENYEGAYNKYLSFRHNVEISTWVTQQKYISILPTLAFSMQYFIQPIVKFTDHITNLKVDQSYHLGQFNFKIFGSGNVRAELERKIESQGYSSVNPWGTAARDIIMDFGYLGGGFFIAFIAGFYKRLFCELEAKQGIIQNALSAIILLSCFLFYFISPLRVAVVFNTLCLCLILKCFERLLIYLLANWPRTSRIPRRGKEI
jgi:hypothetical protein